MNQFAIPVENGFFNGVTVSPCYWQKQLLISSFFTYLVGHVSDLQIRERKGSMASLAQKMDRSLPAIGDPGRMFCVVLVIGLCNVLLIWWLLEENMFPAYLKTAKHRPVTWISPRAHQNNSV
jgi:hypothetical protein